MSAKAGDIARENGIYRCESCAQKVPVRNGAPIRQCSNCGCTAFVTSLISNARPLARSLNGIA